MLRGTKIVATIGPASSDFDMLVKMIRAGVDVVRLNFSHGTGQDHIERAALVRRAAAECGREVAIMADMQGPKIRVGKFEEGKILLDQGDKFILDAKWGSNGELGNQERVGLDYKALPRDVRPGDKLLLNDGLIVLIVDKVVGAEIFTTVRVGGILSNNKGINRQGGGLTAPALTSKDMEDIKTAMAFQADYLAISFPKSATDMEMARQLANIAGEPWQHKPMLIAKIERAEAIPALQEILDASDGIMVARGDLAVEVGNAAVPALQKRMIAMARASNKLTITATQMMESMIFNAVPTRAEVSDVANAVLDGTDAVMLSAETAVGRYPFEAVRAMDRIARAMEMQRPGRGVTIDAALGRRASEGELLPNHRAGQSGPVRTEDAIAVAVCAAAEMLSAPVILCFTSSGFTARKVSSCRPAVPVFACTPEPDTFRQLSLVWGVTSALIEHSTDYDAMLAVARRHILERGLARPGERLVVTAGVPFDMPGTTNLLKIEAV